MSNKRQKSDLRKGVYTVQEAAAKLRVSEQRILEAIDEGLLHAINVGGGKRKHWRILITSFDRWCQQRSGYRAGHVLL
jgi:excisionase family DNA binding protein